MADLALSEHTEDLVPVPVGDPARNPVAVYLARLAPGSRRSQRSALETMSRDPQRGSDRHRRAALARASLPAHSGIESCPGRAVQPGYGESPPGCPAWCPEGGLAARAHVS